MIMQKLFMLQQQYVHNKKYNSQSGYITLLSVIIVTSIGLAIVVFTLLTAVSVSQTTFAVEQTYQAKALANACAEEAMQQVSDSSSYTGTAGLTMGQGECSYSVSGAGQSRVIQSIGTVGTIIRKVKVELDQVSPQLNVLTWQEVADF